MLFPSFFNAQVGGYEIEQSLRFNSADSAYLSRTPGSAGNTQKMTMSVWVKRTALTSTNTDTGTKTIFGATTTGNRDQIRFEHDASGRGDQFSLFLLNDAATANECALSTAARFRDVAGWYHLVIAIDTTQGTAADRVKFYVNGTQITDFELNTQPGQNFTINYFNNNVAHEIGRDPSGGEQLFDGYMSDFNWIDGQQLDASSFGELDDNGVWRPKRYTGSYTGNSFYLKFDAADVDGDSSGLGNDWTASAGISTSGTGTDVMSDTPTTNWCTLNPLDKNSSQSPKDGNLYFDGSVATGGLDVIAGTMRVTSGKYYWESTITNVGSIAVTGVGVTKIQSVGRSVGGSLGGVSGECAYLPSGNKNVDGTNSAYGASFTTGDVIGVALDCDAGTVTFYKNNTSQGAITYVVGGGLSPAVGQVQGYGAIQILNFGQRPFAYTPPTGYKALNTSNLTAPTVKDGSQYFNTVLYTGNNTTHPITGVGFAPDFVWIKPRNFADHHRLNDKIRGVNKTLSSNLTAAEYGPSNAYLDSFDSDGFTISGSNVGWNNSSYTYVAWNWLAGGTGSSNTDGTITSTVSANASAGFSIATYTGNGTAGATVGHGLGVAPSMIITKARGATSEWGVYHSALGNTKALLLNQTYDQQTSSLYWNNTSPTSTLFTLGSGSTTNSSTTYVAYCFAEVEGYSKFGSYTGNGVADGPFIYCGFRPRWVLVKASPTTSQWVMWDTARNTYNFADKILYPNLSSAESVFKMDILSNGFKFREDGGAGNDTGVTYIFAAFAEHPFGGDGVSPATAR